MDPTDVQVTKEFEQRLSRALPGLNYDLELDGTDRFPRVRLSVPGRVGHELAIEILATEATVCYSDGRPPWPAETQFIWGNDFAVGLESVCVLLAPLHRPTRVLRHQTTVMGG